MAYSTLGGLARDLDGIAARVKPDLAKVVAENVRGGTNETQRIARAAAGPHGKNYFKRVSGEVTGPLQGEFGPTGDVEGRAVGAGYRHGRNNDLPKAADIQGPKMAKDVDDQIDKWFW